ncbi:MAG TPA: V-type ATPase 116kDa subunit family protein [Burkholderiaceae bacterium]|nr:V-type ATPase 116kDa subunit family protein [Burkholderiaceae bacterium]
MLRPRPARWFEILAARDDATLVLEALARTGAVELEARPRAGLPAALSDLMPLLAQYAELSARHHAYWPSSASCRPSTYPEAPLATLRRCLETIRAWAQDAEPLIQALQRCEAERSELQLWGRVLGALDLRTLVPSDLAGAGPWVRARLFVLPPGTAPEQALPAPEEGLETVAGSVEIDGAPHLLVVGRPEALQSMAQTVTTLKGSVHDVPGWLRADAAGNQAHVGERLAAIEKEVGGLRADLAALHRRHELPRALGDANRLQWVMRNVRALEASELLCWITGWSSDLQGESLERALHAAGARALLHFATPPVNMRAPLLLSNPRWARPFEVFSRALGMPSSSEADPSLLLAIAVPLMFGYMFGDVGQGLVIAVAAWWLRKRFVIARLLMVGGLSASAFGLVFGSVFGVHKVLPALWLHPLDAPLTVLLVPLVGGAVLLTLGLGLNALEAWWRRQWRLWLLTDAALVIVYLGLLAAFIEPAALWVAAAGALYFCVGHMVASGRLTAGLSALGELIEKTLQIGVNTLSFARVGAFALAHAGLSSAIVALMDAADSALVKALVLLVGNVVVIVLEALVVSIQTTRLVLFEFFTRFMQAQGRAFQPLPAPPSIHQEN